MGRGGGVQEGGVESSSQSQEIMNLREESMCNIST